MKRLFTLAIAVTALLFTAGMASATTYTVNMCGASAQADFWAGAGTKVLAEAFSCTSTGSATVEDNDKSLIIQGTGCTITGLSGTHTIYLRYLASNSMGGCNNYTCQTIEDSYADPSTCTFTEDGGECTGTEDAACMMGCADVPCPSLNAKTKGYYNGRADYEDNGIATMETFNVAGAYTGDTKLLEGIVVPFGFIVNNKVTHHVCNYDSVPSDAHFAYDKRGWECDADDANACVGNYKCLNGYCQDGTGTTACSTAADCSMADVGPTVNVTCDVEPLDNISRLMALHIFADKVDNWQDFGAGFVDLPIVKCMRHAGSGTHQTLIDTVFRGDESVKWVTVRAPSDGTYVWHYESSSTLTTDCVERYDGAIGYVDADKVMYRKGLKNGIHQLKYQGEAPSRYDVVNGKYNFWAAQACFISNDQSCASDGTVERDILVGVMDTAASATFLTEEIFGERAKFWATQGEMKVFKTDSDPANYPSR